jgi:hypothetical protein
MAGMPMKMAILAPAGLYVNWSAIHPSKDKDSTAKENNSPIWTLLEETRVATVISNRWPDNPSDLRLESLNLSSPVSDH